MTELYAVVGAGALALIFAFVRSRWIAKQDTGTDEMRVIAGHIQEGAMAFLAREYKVLALFVAVVAVLLGVSNAAMADSHALIALAFVIGATCSGLAGYFGMKVATQANVRTTAAARTGLAHALIVAFTGGSVMGMAVVGLGLVGLTGLLLFMLQSGLFGTGEVLTGLEYTRILNVLAGFSLGASSIALFARVGGGIYTKAADVGADLVGKVEAGIPEDSPRNPATIADNVGDNVGDVAGMGADLFESYVGAIIGSMILGLGLHTHSNIGDGGIPALIWLPLYLAAVGIGASIIGTFFVRTKEGGNPQTALNVGTIIASLLMIGGAYFTIANFIADGIYFSSSPRAAPGRQRRDPDPDAGRPEDRSRHGHLLRDHLRPHRRRPHRVRHRVLHLRRIQARQVHRRAVQDRRGHQHHRRHRRRHDVHGAPDRADHHGHPGGLLLRRPLRRGHLGARHALDDRHPAGRRRLRPHRRQRRRHRRDEPSSQGSPRAHRQAGRRRQHHRRHRQGLRHRLGGPDGSRSLQRLHDQGRHPQQRPRPARPRDHVGCVHRRPRCPSSSARCP